MTTKDQIIKLVSALISNHEWQEIGAREKEQLNVELQKYLRILQSGDASSDGIIDGSRNSENAILRCIGKFPPSAIPKCLLMASREINSYRDTLVQERLSHFNGTLPEVVKQVLSGI